MSKNREPEISERKAKPAKARDTLGWKAETTFDQLVRTMVDADLDYLQGKLKGIS